MRRPVSLIYIFIFAIYQTGAQASIRYLYIYKDNMPTRRYGYLLSLLLTRRSGGFLIINRIFYYAFERTFMVYRYYPSP